MAGEGGAEEVEDVVVGGVEEDTTK